MTARRRNESLIFDYVEIKADSIDEVKAGRNSLGIELSGVHVLGVFNQLDKNAVIDLIHGHDFCDEILEMIKEIEND